MSLDHDGRQLLAARAARRPAFWGEVPDVSGSDTDSLVTLTVDAAARVTRVETPAAERLREARRLERSVLEAYRAADTARAISVQLSRDAEEPPATATELVAALRPRAQRVVDVATYRPLSDPGLPPDPALAGVPARASLAATGRSDNGYLEVELGVVGDPVAVRADGAWLSAATFQTLAGALLSAFRAAQTPRGGTRWPSR